MRQILLLTLPLLLAGCAVFSDEPNGIGRGYASYNQEYHAPPGPKPDSLGYEYSAQANRQILTAWRNDVADLLNTLEHKTQLSHDIYVGAPPRTNAFFSTFDHVLREELTARGYHLVQQPSGNILSYDADSPDGRGLGLLITGDESTPMQRGDSKIETRKFILELKYGQPAQQPVATARTIYDLPESGYYLLDQVWHTTFGGE